LLNIYFQKELHQKIQKTINYHKIKINSKLTYQRKKNNIKLLQSKKVKRLFKKSFNSILQLWKDKTIL